MIEFFADIGSNYICISTNTDRPRKNVITFDRAAKLIRDAADSGCTGVKFQYFKAEHLWSKDKKLELSLARYRELPLEWIPSLSAFAKKYNLLFGLSVFDIEAVEEVVDFVDYFKIASFEAGWFELVNACYMTGKRLQISLGQVNQDEIKSIISKLPDLPNQIDLLHCISKYPSKLEDCNLNVIKHNPIINGYSDHTTEKAAIYGAINAGAKVIEFHLDDGLGLEKDHSWFPWPINNVISTVRTMEKAMGNGDWDEVAKLQEHQYKVNPKTGLRG
jgi:N-acetylneuraminate synthase